MAPRSIPSLDQWRRFPSGIGIGMLVLGLLIVCGGLIFSRRSVSAPPAMPAIPVTLAGQADHEPQAALGDGEITTSPSLAGSPAPFEPESESFDATADEAAEGQARSSSQSYEVEAPAVEERPASKPAAQVATTLVSVGGVGPSPTVRRGEGRSRQHHDNGIIFSGQSDQIAVVKAKMHELLAQMGWTNNQVLVRESAAGERIAYVLNGTLGDTNTFVLSQQPQLGITQEMITYVSRQGQSKKLAIVSQKEILATMLQAGRAFSFVGPRCNVDLLKEQIALRQNIVYWGLRADWVFPEDKIYRYNTADFWQVMTGDDWTLKPGIAARAAIADAFVGKFSYQIGCTSACRFIFAHGILDFFQQVRPNPTVLARLEQLLDSRHPFVEIAPMVDRRRVVVKEGRLMDRHVDVPWNHWVPGDWGWIKNPDDKSSEELGSEGCNIIYAGGGFFVNYYPERPPKTLDQALKRVYGWRFGLEESELDLPAQLMDELRQDPRSGGMLRDVRDFPKNFAAPPAPAGA